LLTARPQAGKMENSMKYTNHPGFIRINPVVIPQASYSSRPEIVAASAFEGRPVVSTHGEDIGKVGHVMMDAHTGQATYVVISRRGTPGTSAKLHAIPWTALVFDAKNTRFILNIDPDVMENAPGFDNEHWPVMTSPSWQAKIHGYYKQRDYWPQPAVNQAKVQAETQAG
jgi:sporulation protein YlmC with PRC-barrel domain